ncbi:MAG TPA: phenylalanine--tRNA ligase subunit beta [Candidatus Binatia bacterium]|nr:phenylalanine--tRNA ligase subunit beta [Candidatus Binatia bacterium]
MRVPLSWLAEFVSWRDPVAVLAERLVMAGLKVEAVEEVGRLDARIRVGRLAGVERHPDAAQLHVCRVDAGGRTPIVIVSGAPGLRAEMRVAVALPGARLADGREVAGVSLRGVESAGVLCSEAECGLGDDASTVLALADDAPVGRPLVELAGIADTVLELEVTPNRGDCLSILGVAREVAAVTGARLRHPRPRPREAGGPAAAEVRVRVEAPDLCPRYGARVLRGVRVGPSPLGLRLRLQRAGMRPINAVVDATNYVMLERGQPLHAFDLERVAERAVVVRRARGAERIVTLDGVERVLEGGDLVIADGRGPVAIAGIMGGQDSEVTAATRVVLLESAHFVPATVRRTRRRLGLASQAAHRFERGVDPALVPEAANAAAALIAQLAGGRVAPGLVEEAPGLAALAPPVVRLRPRRAMAVLGVAVPRAEAARRLRRLGARCRPVGDALAVTPPSFRPDLRLEEDLIEEIARLGGYDRVPVTLPEAPVIGGVDDPARAGLRRVRRLLAAEGLAETVTLAFTDAPSNRALPGFVGRALAPVAVRNPLSSETGELRRSPLSGLVRVLRTNLERGATFVGVFELGKGYGVDAGGARREPRAVAVLLHGAWPPRGVERAGPAVDFLDLKGMIVNLLAGLGCEEVAVRWAPTAEVGFLHPGKAAVVRLGGAAVGVAGALHPEVVQGFDLAGEVWVAELDFADVAHYVPRRSIPRPVPRFPAVTRDIAAIVDEAFLADAILEEVRAFDDPRIESARLFDCYRGAPVAAGRKSLAYTIAYRAPDRTLTDDEVNALHARLREHLRRRFTLELRS